MNALLPLLLFAIAFMVPHNLVVGQVLVEEVAPNSPAAMAGIEPGDTFLRISGKPVRNTGDLQRYIQLNLGKEITTLVQHSDSTTEEVRVIPRWKPPEGQGAIGIVVNMSYSSIVSQHEPFWKAIPLANRHPRVDILKPGPGVGGHCISVDPWFFVEAAPDLTNLIHTARMVNDTQPKYVLSFLERKSGDIRGKKVAALGLAYKPDVDDLRESPAIETVKLLRDAGAEVHTYEPFNLDYSIEGVKTARTLEHVAAQADIILLLVGHTQLKEIDSYKFAESTSARVVLDTVNGWDRDTWQSAGFTYYRLGDGKNN